MTARTQSKREQPLAKSPSGVWFANGLFARIHVCVCYRLSPLDPSETTPVVTAVAARAALFAMSAVAATISLPLE